MRKNHTAMSTYFSNKSLQQNKDLSGIFNMYIKPFIEFFLDENMLDKNSDIVDIFFHSMDRKIITCRATESFKIPGMYKQAALKHISGHIVSADPKDRIYVRLDRTMPDEIDLEVLKKSGSSVFRLTLKQFKGILSYLIID